MARVKSAGAPVDIFQGLTMPESFNLDRVPTPIGMALLVTDADGLLRALDWEDYEPRMEQLLRLHYGAVNLNNARAPRELRTALTGSCSYSGRPLGASNPCYRRDWGCSSSPRRWGTNPFYTTVRC